MVEYTIKTMRVPMQLERYIVLWKGWKYGAEFKYKAIIQASDASNVY